METTLAKNRTGYWAVRWSEKHPDGTYRSREVSTRTRDRKAAVQFQAELTAELNRKALPAKPTIAAIVESYTKLHLEPNRRGETQGVALRAPVAILGHLEPAAVTADVLLQYRLSRKRADGTLRRELGALVAALNWAARQKLIARDDVPTVGLPPDGGAADVYLSEDDEKRLWWHAVRDMGPGFRLSRVARFIAIALDTGARKEAIETLTWDRVDLTRGFIDFRDPGRRASKKRRVPVPVSQRLRPVLDRAFLERRSAYVLDHGGSIRKAFSTFVLNAGFHDVTPHVLRHTWATLAAQHGVSLWDIAGVLGDTIETTTKHYAHHQPEHLRSAVDARWKSKEN